MGLLLLTFAAKYLDFGEEGFQESVQEARFDQRIVPFIEYPG
jgi:hypothetical protein